MTKNIVVTSMIVCVVFMVGCAPAPQMSPMQMRQITTRTLECSYENAFRATMSVLQDQQYVIKQTDMNAGFILAQVNRQTAGGTQFLQALLLSKYDTDTLVEVSASIGKLNEATQDVRLSIQEVTYNSVGAKSRTKQIDNPEIYQQLFNDITVEIKRREAMKK